jgi:hypothetical protein
MKFLLNYRLNRDQAEWNQISNNVKPGGNFVVLDLEPASWYSLRVTAHNNAGFTVAEYDFATLTVNGGKFLSVLLHAQLSFYLFAFENLRGMFNVDSSKLLS